MTKPFTLFLAEVNDGNTGAALTADLAELLATVQRTGRSGSLTLKVKVAPATKSQATGSVDKVNLTCERKLELPKPEAPTDFYWLTDAAELSRNHPRQQSLELRDVAGSGVVNSSDLKTAT